MAEMTKSILGKVSGSLGDITFRLRDGKSILSTRPVSFVPGRDPASVARRQRFRLSIKLAQAVNSIEEIKPLWAADTAPRASAFNRIMRVNYPALSAAGPSEFVRLTPSLGFSVKNPAFTPGTSGFTVGMDAIGDQTGIDPAAEPSLKLASVVYLGNPGDEMMQPYTFLRFVSEAKATDLAAALEFTFPLGDVETRLLETYQDKMGFFVLLALDTAGHVVHHSDTFTGMP